MPKRSLPAGNRGMGSENVRGDEGLSRFPEGKSLLCHDEADSLEGQESRMSFVHVGRGDFYAESGESPDAADAEDNLLANPRFLIAAVEGGSDRSVFGGVFGDVGIEKIEARPADLDLPDRRLHQPSGQFDRDEYGGAVGIAALLDRHVVPVVLRIGLLLETVGVQVLFEVALAIQEADADEGQAQIA